ncbi:Zinc finger, CCHC-type [Sesbania bispinosa]|nr:Zinc finger, CCHC-type [Sesbania bispinosa]
MENLTATPLVKRKISGTAARRRSILSLKDQTITSSPKEKPSYKDMVTASEMLRKIQRKWAGKFLGTMLKIDQHTSIHSRGETFKVEYEGLHLVCFNCGKYGHKMDSCVDNLIVQNVTPAPNPGLKKTPTQDLAHGPSSIDDPLNNEPVSNTQPPALPPPKQIIIPTKSNHGSKSRTNKKEQPKSSRLGSMKQASVKPKPVVVPKVQLAKPMIDEQMDYNAELDKYIERRKKEQEYILGGFSSASFWGPPNTISTVPTHHLALDKKDSETIVQSVDMQVHASQMEEDSSNAHAQGARLRIFPGPLQDVIRIHQLAFVALLEPWISGDRVDSVITKIGLNGHTCVKQEDFHGAYGALIYASTIETQHMELWNELLRFSQANRNVPWLVARDFNTILYEAEKSGGGPVCRSSLNIFSQCLDVCLLVDVVFKGPRFTWSNGRLRERQERIIAKESRRSKFVDSTLINLPFPTSDHTRL